MRPLKFRAWDGTAMRYDVTGFEHGNGNEMAGVFLDGDYYCISDTADKCFGDLHNRAVVMQFTGLLDSKGAEIYEGDIVRSGMTGADYVVFWSEENSAWYKQTIGLNVKDRPIYSDSNSRVIGNIHENPEFLK